MDPRSVFAELDGGPLHAVRFANGRIRIPVAGLAAGRHRVTLQVSDHQEAKNMENVPRILPNTTTLAASFSVR